jgi:putative PEP-CTERM system histidine kinase
MLLAVTHGLGCASLLAVILLMLLNRRPEGVGLFAAAVFFITALWAGLQATQLPALMGLSHVLESFKGWMWLQLLATIIFMAKSQAEGPSKPLYWYVILLIGLLLVVNDARYLIAITSPVEFGPTQILGRILLASTGVLLVENIYRNTIPARRWHIFPLCLAAGVMFSYDLFLFVNAVIVGEVNLALIGGQGLVLFLISPLLILTMARNEDWRVDVHVSRRIVFHTATMTMGGIFLLSAGGVASLFGNISGVWGPILQIFFFIGSLIVLGGVLGAASFRNRMWRFMAENFFSHRYDYREEWMQLVDTLSETDSTESLQERIIRAVANVVECPGGALWLEKENGDYQLSKSLNYDIEGTAIEPSGSDFIEAFKDGEAIQDLRQEGSSISCMEDAPSWLKAGSPAYLAVPLKEKDHLIGFIVLVRPRQGATLNWESFGLLRTIGRQVASYLSQERATRLLSESRAIAEYNKRFAFVVHDVKNLASQLKMLVSNIQKFGDNPEFKRDLAKTLENSVFRLDNLLTRLRSGVVELEKKEVINPVRVLEDVISNLAQENVLLQTNEMSSNAAVLMGPVELRSVLTHLIANALEASPSDENVNVRLSCEDESVLIDIEDKGPGMDPSFIRERLFKPFQTTKSGGHGIGAFQAREIVKDAGGDLIVTSAPDNGTTIRIKLPIVPLEAAEISHGVLRA